MSDSKTTGCEHDWITDPMSGIRYCAHCRADQPETTAPRDEIVEFLQQIRTLTGRDQMVVARARNAVPTQIQPGSLSYVAFVWTWLIDELIGIKTSIEAGERPRP